MESPRRFGRIAANSVRYIKLGRAGRLEDHCINNGLCYLGFSTDNELVFSHATMAASLNDDTEWGRLREVLLSHDSNKDEHPHNMVATLAANQIRSFFSAGSETLWITFHNGKLYYAFLDSKEAAIRAPEYGGSFRKVVGSWSCEDAEADELLVDKISGQVTKTQLYRGTSCELDDGPARYLLRRINCEQHSYVSRIEAARVDLEAGIQEAIQFLTPQDFELLVDLVFSTTLRRISSVGKVQKYVDMIYENPLVRSGESETVCVQVKSRTTRNQLKEYLDNPQRKTYDHFYYVYHQSDGTMNALDDILESYPGSIRLIDAKELASLVIETGLISWVLNKVG